MDILAEKSKAQTLTEEAIIKHHTLLVKRIAYHLLGRLPQSIQFEDLVQAGMMGLLEAVNHYDESKGASFETYASIRIRGFMLDEVRKNDWVPRSVYKNARLIAQTVRRIENELGREAKDFEVAMGLGITLDEYHEMLNDAVGAHLYGFEDLGVTDDILIGENETPLSEPHTVAINADLKNRLAAAIDTLPKNEKLVLSLYYQQDLNLKEIGDILGVSESRVSQIHTQATLRIKSRLPDAK